jgi:hypothetical protein
MKLCDTVRSREWCLEHHQGYTEIGPDRYCLFDGIGSQKFTGNHILFAYEYTAEGAETGLNHMTAYLNILASNIRPVTYTQTFGGHVNSQGNEKEEHGYLLTFDEKLSPVSLGALAHKIATLFRQESVLAIYESEVTFVYA